MTLCGSTISWEKIGRGFWRNQLGSGFLGFLANPPLSTNLVCLYQLPLSSASYVIPLSMMSCWGFYIWLRSQYFPLALFAEGFRSCHLKWLFCISLVTSKISLGIRELRINFVGHLSSKLKFLMKCYLIGILVLGWSSSRDMEHEFRGNLSIKMRFLAKLYFSSS